VGVEIKRIDSGTSDTSQQITRDVYQLQMETLDGRPRVYRNEDNFLYGKFDSANLQAQIQSLATDKSVVALRHYGWRMTLFSTFPNAISVWPVEEGYRHIPVFNGLVYLGLALLGFLGFQRFKRAKSRQEEKRRLRDAERAAAAERKAEDEKNRARASVQNVQADVDDFLNSGSSKPDGSKSDSSKKD
jgi:hypothetical protein